MILPKWSKKDLLYMKEQGYGILKCDNEEAALKVKNILKQNKRCAQAGYIPNKEGENISFVVTKKRNI